MTNLRRCLLFLGLGLSTNYATALNAAAIPWPSEAEECLVFSLTEEAGIARQQEPVILRGQEILDRAGLKSISVSSCRLFASEREIPVQVDERDGGRTWAAHPNGRLDPDDELVFQADVPADSVLQYRLYYGSKPSPRSDPPETDLTVGRTTPEKSSRLEYDIRLANSVFETGLRTVGDSSSRMAGSIVSLTVGGRQLLAYRNTPLLLTRFQEPGIPWPAPVICAGPVRTTVVARRPLDGIYRHPDGDWAVSWDDYAAIKGEMFRSFTLYAHRPFLDIKDEFFAERTGADFNMNYNFLAAPPPDGRSWEKTRQVLFTRGDSSGTDTENYRPESAGRYLTNKEKNGGWIGTRDERSGLGLAVFYPPSTARVYWSFTQPWVRKDSSLWEDAHTALFTEVYNEDVLTRGRGSNSFRLAILNGETPAQVAALHRTSVRYALGDTIAWAGRPGRPGGRAETLEVPTRRDPGPDLVRKIGEQLSAVTQYCPAGSEFQKTLAGIRGLPAGTPAARRARLDQARALAQTVAAWTNTFPVGRLRLLHEDTAARQRGFTTFVADSLEKILPDGPLPGSSAGKVRLSLAHNEYEGFQVGLVAAGPDETRVKVSVSDLVGPGGFKIDAGALVRRYRVGLVATADEGESGGRTVALPGRAEWPDPLLPLPGCPDFPGSSLFPAQESDLSVLARDKTTVFWFTVYAPRQAPAGEYRGAVTFAGTRGSVSLPISVTVYNFELPEKQSLTGDVWFMNNIHFARYYGHYPSLEEYAGMVRFMDTYRVSSQLESRSMTPLLGVSIEEDGTYSYDFSKLDPWLALVLERGNWFNANLSCHAGWIAHFSSTFFNRQPVLDKRTGQTLLFPEKQVPYEKTLPEPIFKSFWPAYERHLKDKGWLDRCFLYLYDEPPYGPARRDLPVNVYFRNLYAEVKQLAPGFTLACNGTSPSPLMHSWAAPYLDMWGPDLAGLEENKDFMKPLNPAGKPFLTYLCGGSRRNFAHHVPDVYISNPAIDLRIVPWMIFSYGGKGVLYYAANEWIGDSQVGRVEKSPEKRWPAKPWDFRGDGFGNGWFIYPAPKCRFIYPSIRLENIRDGLEDYEYLALLKKLAGADSSSVDARVRSVVTNVLLWSEDPATLRKTREEIAHAIESLRRD